MTERTYYSRESAQRARQSRIQLAAIAFVLGAGVGAGVALLAAPGPGADVRRSLANTADEGMKLAKQQAQDVADRAKEAVS